MRGEGREGEGWGGEGRRMGGREGEEMVRIKAKVKREG